MGFTWKNNNYVKYTDPRERKKIAAVAIDTDQITHIFDSCNIAARTILRSYYSKNITEDIIKEYAGDIAKAAAAYHKEVLGFYWKWI